MINEVLIDTEIYKVIVNDLSFSAMGCMIDAAEVSEPILNKSTSIMELLEDNSEELNHLVNKHRTHSGCILPESLDKLKQSLINADQALADAMHYMQ